jgi:hypothetical protein
MFEGGDNFFNKHFEQEFRQVKIISLQAYGAQRVLGG